MRVFAQRVLFLIAFAAIVAVVTYRSVVDGSAPKGPEPFDRPARPSDVGFSTPVEVSQPSTQDSSPPEFDSEIVGDILRIRERLRGTPHGSAPAVDTGTTAEFAASLRDVIANRATDSFPASSNSAVSLHDGIRPPPDEPPSIPIYPPILAAPRLGIPYLAPLGSPALAPSMAPSMAPAVATVNSRADVVVSLRQIGRQFDLLAADLEDQRQFEDAESLRNLVQTIRAEARRLEEDLVR